MVFEDEGMIKLLVLRTQPGGDRYHKANALPTFMPHNGNEVAV